MRNATPPELDLDADALSRRQANSNALMQLRIPRNLVDCDRCAAGVFHAPACAQNTRDNFQRIGRLLIVDEQQGRAEPAWSNAHLADSAPSHPSLQPGELCGAASAR